MLKDMSSGYNMAFSSFPPTFLSLPSDETKQWTNLLTDKQHVQLHRKLIRPGNLGKLSLCPSPKQTITDINMFNLLAALPELYGFCWCCGEEVRMQQIINTETEACRSGAADWLWPPAKRLRIGCWPLKATYPLFSGFGGLIAKNCNTDSNRWLKDTLRCLQLIWVYNCITVVCVCRFVCVNLSETLGLIYELNAKIHLLLLKSQVLASADKTVTPPHRHTAGCNVCQDSFQVFGIKISQPRRSEKQILDQNIQRWVCSAVSEVSLKLWLNTNPAPTASPHPPFAWTNGPICSHFKPVCPLLLRIKQNRIKW